MRPPLAMPRPGRRATILALPAVLLGTRARAQPAPAWPERRVRLVTPAAPGSAPDFLARALAEPLAARWGQPVVIENRPGADGIPALEAMLAARPGDALLLSNHGVLTMAPILHPTLAVDPFADVTPIAELAADQFGVTVPPDLGVSSLAELATLARARPGQLNWTGSPGPPWMVFRAFLRDQGIAMEHVAFRGVGGQVVAELMAGRVQVLFSPLPPVMGAVRDRRLRLLAVTAPARVTAAPDTPTALEQGFPGFLLEGGLGLHGWKGMPAPLAARLASEVGAALADPALRASLVAAGQEPRGGTPGALVAKLGEQRARWMALARDIGVGRS